MKFDRLEGGVSLQALAFKYAEAFDASPFGHVELALALLDAFGMQGSGLSDTALRVRPCRDLWTALGDLRRRVDIAEGGHA